MPSIPRRRKTFHLDDAEERIGRGFVRDVWRADRAMNHGGKTLLEIRDEELEIRLEPSGNGETLVRMSDRYEGVLAVFVDAQPRRDDVDVMLAGLKRRAESTS